LLAFPVAAAIPILVLQFPYTCAVVTEALRLYPPGANTLRETNDEPFQLGAYTLPARTTLVVGTYVMQRDPKIWPQAATFMPERWLPVSGHHTVWCCRHANIVHAFAAAFTSHRAR
jgi:cytochrome P450